jgi:hypothetical protein
MIRGVVVKLLGTAVACSTRKNENATSEKCIPHFQPDNTMIQQTPVIIDQTSKLTWIPSVFMIKVAPRIDRIDRWMSRSPVGAVVNPRILDYIQVVEPLRA